MKQKYQSRLLDLRGRSQKTGVWNRNFTLLIGATVCGSAGAIAASYGLSFLVFYETGSVLLSALVLVTRLVPSFLLPLVAGPLLDRYPRKKALVLSDALNGILYLVMGTWLLVRPFSYPAYLLYSLVLSCTEGVDELAFDSILPMVMTKGMQQKSYAAAGMVYPFLNIIMMPLAALILGWVGIPALLLLQGVLSLAASWLDSRIRLEADLPRRTQEFDLSAWKEDVQEALLYLKQEKGLLSFFTYSAFTNGIGSACYPVLVAFFSTTPGLNPMLFSAFAVAESLGRCAGSVGQYVKVMKNSRKYGFSLFVMITYNCLDAILLFVSYPLMLFNRFGAGILGATTYTLRTAAIQTYVPDAMRARINSFQNLLYYGISSVLTLVFGVLGDLLRPEWVMVCGALLGMGVLCLTWIRHASACQAVFEAEPEPEGK